MLSRLTTAVLVSVASCAFSFVPSSSSRAFAVSSSSAPTTRLYSSSDYDTVTVDLADGRDYPIYIGAGFPDEEGACFA